MPNDRIARPSLRAIVGVMNVLVVDDEAELLDLAVRALERDGHVVRSANTLAKARQCVVESLPEVMVLDVGMPDGSGFDLCRSLRRDGFRFPILVLTANGEVPRRVEGLDAGADDFVSKPFAVVELRARVRALGRRGPMDRALVVQVGDIELDFGSRRATRGGVEAPITKREWAVLEILAIRAGRVVSRNDILESAWGEAEDSAQSSLEVLIARIRRKLSTELVRTVRGEGYALGHD